MKYANFYDLESLTLLNRHVRGIDRNGTISFRKIKDRRTPNFTGCHKAVPAYLAFITEKEGKQ